MTDPSRYCSTARNSNEARPRDQSLWPRLRRGGPFHPGTMWMQMRRTAPVATVVRIVGLALLVALAVARPAAAQQRPLVTEDPESVGAGRILIESGFDYTRDNHYPASGLEGHLLRVPLIGFSIGLSSIAELQIDGGFYNRLSVTGREPAPLSFMVDQLGASVHDVEDVVVATKIRVAAETKGRPSFGVRFATKLPNASNESGLGPDTTDFYASVPVAK